MSQVSTIEWTNSTWNPVTGCSKISAGCKNCYASTFSERFRGTPGHYFENGFDLTLRPDKLVDPIKWKKPRMIFVNSMSDLFHKEIPESFIDSVFETMVIANHHTYQVLTKRPLRMAEYIRKRFGSKLPLNIWLGVSVEDEKNKERIQILRTIRSKTHFLSIEPLLGDLKLTASELKGVSWIIVGGESGHSARPMKEAWAMKIRHLCHELEIPFFFKQWGAFNNEGVRMGKIKSGRILDGNIYSEMPRQT
jgi:protein gp37